MVGEGAVVGPDTTLTDVHGRRGRLASSARTAATSEIGAGATVGPFAYLRPGTTLGAKGKIGTFVEVKNSEIGDRLARSRTCPTSATRRSASTATSARPACSSTTTA